MAFFQGTQEWVRNRGGKCAISVRAIEVLLYIYSSEELVTIQEDLITISLTTDVMPLKTPVDLGDLGWHQVCLLWSGDNQGQWGVFLDGMEKRGGTQYAKNHKIVER